jgi:hypothetical protein
MRWVIQVVRYESDQEYIMRVQISSYFLILFLHTMDLELGVLTDRILFDFIHDPIQKIMKIIRFVSVSISGDIRIWIYIRNSFMDVNTVRPLPICIWPFSYYLSISDIIWKYPIWFYLNMYPKYFYYIFFNQIFIIHYKSNLFYI